jgi:putative ABC transport system substrate-binding protein
MTSGEAKGFMRRRDFLSCAGGLAVAWPFASRAQQPTMPVIGYLHSRGPDDSKHIVAGFLRGLRDSGLIQGQNVRVEYRWAEGQFERLPSLARELAAIPVNVLVAGGGSPVPVAAKSVTSSIPIVFAMSGDPIKLAASYNRPGGNVTGVDIYTTTLDPKRISLLHDLVPSAGVIGFLANAGFAPSEGQIRDAEAAARAIGIGLRVLRANDQGSIEAAFKTIRSENIRALAVASSPYFDLRRGFIVEAAARNAVPAIYHFREYVTAGGLVSYGIDIVDTYHQIGLYVGQILNGAKPGELPILRPTKFDLVINLKTAKSLGLTVPSGILAIADDVIE